MMLMLMSMLALAVGDGEHEANGNASSWRMALELLLLQGRAGLENRLCRAGGDFGPLLSLDLRPFVDWSRFLLRIVINFEI